MMTIDCYEKSLFEQQTPYLQWLKEREAKRKINRDKNKGKHMIRLPFFSCEESVETCLERVGVATQERADKLQDMDFILFTGENGFVDEDAEYFFSEYFSEHSNEQIVYADEDYLGSLQDIYGERVAESDFARTYQYEDTGLYRGFPWFKPDYSPDTLRAFFYIGNLFAVRGTALAKLFTAWNQAGEGTKTHSIYEMVLTITEETKHAGHISEVLFTNRNIQDKEELPGSEEIFIEMKKALTNEVNMQAACSEKGKNALAGLHNEAKIASVDTIKKIQTLCYPIPNSAVVSVIIPSKDHSEILKRCLSTLVELTNYPHYEIILVDNGSSKQEQMCIRSVVTEITEDYDLKWANDDSPMPELSIQYIYQESEFNFSAMCNLGAKAAKGEYLLFLNDDMEVIQPFWMKRMLGQAACTHTGAVGAKLYYPREQEQAAYRIQHAGITNMGIGPAHKLAGMEDTGNLYHGRNLLTYNMLAVTAACLMVKKELFLKAGGFDEELAVAYNDVELCFRFHEMGYYNVQRNDVILLHHESLSRGQDTSAEKAARLECEKRLLYKKHPALTAKDPFYSENLVQWKKDVEYTCNYLYPCDKVIKPVLLDKAEIKALPKEHQNKLVRKLSGENLFMLQIDCFTLEEEGRLSIEGWFVMRERDNAKLDRTILLKNTDNGEVYQLAWYPKLRYDVEMLFCEKTEGQKTNTLNTALSCIQRVVDAKELTQGSYIIGILVEERKGLCAGKICWKKEISVERHG